MWSVISSASNLNGSLLPRSIEKRTMKLKLENQIEWQCTCADTRLSTTYTRLPMECHFFSLKSELSSLGLFCHVPLKWDLWKWDWRFRLNHTPIAIGCIKHFLFFVISLHFCDLSSFLWSLFTATLDSFYLSFLSWHLCPLFISLSSHHMRWIRLVRLIKL